MKNEREEREETKPNNCVSQVSSALIRKTERARESENERFFFARERRRQREF